MHDKLSQAVKLYDQLLSAQVAQPPRRSAVSTYPHTPRQAGPDAWISPPQVSSSTWVSPQPHPTSPPPGVTHPFPSFVAPVSHSIGYHNTSLSPQPTQLLNSSMPPNPPNQGYAPIPMSTHPSLSLPQQGTNPVDNHRTFPPPRHGTANIEPPSLPSFPTAPTLPPQSSYMPSVPQSVIQQPDRQEALLIDL